MYNIAHTIREGASRLCANRPYISIGQAFSEEGTPVSALHVNKTDEYSNFDAIERFQSDIQRFLESLGNPIEASCRASIAINSLVRHSLAGFCEESAWVLMRGSNPTSEFDVPRWHFDGHYFSPYYGDPKKLVVTLKGPGTRFAAIQGEEREAFNELMNLSRDLSDHVQVIANTVRPDQIDQAALQEIYLYIVGANHAAIHAEPPIHEDRLFLSLVPGNSAQIEALRARWNEKRTSYA